MASDTPYSCEIVFHEQLYLYLYAYRKIIAVKHGVCGVAWLCVRLSMLKTEVRPTSVEGVAALSAVLEAEEQT